MGQRPLATAARRSGTRAAKTAAALPTASALCLFPTELGWFGIRGSGKRIEGLWIGHVSADEVRSAVARRAARGAGRTGELPVERDWNPTLRRLLQGYTKGVRADFRQFDVDLGSTTDFRRRILNLTRKIPYGRTLSYGELAARAGSPQAARGVGSAMASNPAPIVIPCHRVVASGGSIGGYSAPQGLDLKRRLLALEGLIHFS